MIIDTHAHVVPGSLIETLRSERRLFPSVRLLAEADSARPSAANDAARHRAVAGWRARRAGARGGARQRLQGAMIGTQPKGVGEISTSVPAPC